MLCTEPLIFVDLDKMLPKEELYADRVDWLVSKIEVEKTWRVPVTLDRDSFAIMNGHHRTAAAQQS